MKPRLLTEIRHDHWRSLSYSQQKFQNIVRQAVLAEELGFNAYGTEER
ncbi:LLM class flavin-dependent oxidoreductase [Paenibacillus polymyxa]|nr:LLM class flavin-dependent oxidoreductase [Paenibacillus polymyxa]MDN4090591.1 LLM class flavin-dependent oxidoreductase [Paenibacillus polymyxa]